MTINITLFIQIINFLITYYFLNIYLFKPVLRMLDERNAQYDAVREAIHHEEQVLLKEERSKDAQLHFFQKKVHTRVFTPPPPKPVSYDLSYHLDKRELNTLVENAKNVIVREISRVR